MESTVTYNDGNEEVHIMEVEEDTARQSLARKRADSILGKIQSVVTYTIDDKPPLYTTVMLAFQHFLTLLSGAIAMPLIMAPVLCIRDDLEMISKVMATTFLVCAIQTFIQATVGTRLAIVQGPSFAFMLPIFAMMKTRDHCPVLGESSGNNTTVTEVHVRSEFRDRMQEVQGAVVLGGLFEFILGFSGVISLLLRYIGPLTIAPTLGLIGLGLFDVCAGKASLNWGISALTMILLVVFSQYMERLKIPCVGYTKEKRCHVVRFPLFKLFPIILAVMLSWLLCFILTTTDVFPEPEKVGYRARTDLYTEELAGTPWFYFPYPGQFGAPTVTLGGVIGMITASIASVVESIGDYYACAKLSGAPPPPSHAVNRGIGIEGLGVIFSGIWGTGVGSTSYSTNIGAIGITKVGSRYVIQVMCVILGVVGVFLKLGALFASIPEPIIGGLLSVIIGLVTAVGFSNLQYADMNSPRNLFIVGFSFFVGMAIPSYMNNDAVVINTGLPTLDQTLLILLTTGMFLGGATGFILDNTVPGTQAERGLKRMREVYDTGEEGSESGETDEEMEKEVKRLVLQCYDLPFGMAYLRKWTWTSYLPFSPTFNGIDVGRKFRHCLPKRFKSTHDKIENV